MSPSSQMPIQDQTISSRQRFISYYAKFMTVVGTLGQSLFYLQAYKIYSQRSAQDVSLEGFAVSLFSMSSWLVYGLLIKDKVLIITNVIGVLGAVLTCGMILWMG